MAFTPEEELALKALIQQPPKTISQLEAEAGLSGDEVIVLEDGEGTFAAAIDDLKDYTLNKFSNKRVIISNNVSDANNDIDFAAGKIQFSDGSGRADYAGGTGQLDVVFGTGNGMLATGTKQNNSTYHLFIIYNPTTKTAKPFAILGIANTTPSPTLPSGYTKSQRVGSIKTDSSGDILAFTQNDKTFLLNNIIQPVNISASNTASDHDVKTPLGISTLALVNFYAETGGVNNFYLITNPSSNTIVSTTNYNASVSGNGGPVTCSTSSPLTIKTNTSSEVSINATSASGTIEVNLLGWIDYEL